MGKLLVRTLIVGAVACAVGVSQAQAQSVVFDISGFISDGSQGGATNGALSQFVSAGAEITGYSYNVTYTSDFRREALIGFGPTGAPSQVFFTFNNDGQGTGTYSGSSSVSGVTLGNDGLLNLRLFESLDDFGPDGIYEPGSTVTFTYSASAVPEPASWAMLIGGFAAAGGALRRRRARTTVPA